MSEGQAGWAVTAGLVVTAESDQMDAEAGNGNTLMRHHPR